ncbi:hypothetical protein ABLG96_12155 [Nakamurella sp. A5-74]|uniref:Uncharacterized protein n=1 Tax=Nakamurella sp. A5-74 TaxID=3158264 RepID=A0AAU8DJT9_9ACTN
MHDPETGLTFDPVVVGRLSAELHELALRWLTSAGDPAATPGAFGTDRGGAELSSALPVFLARALEARRRGCALLEAAATAVESAAGTLDEFDRAGSRAGGPR